MQVRFLPGAPETLAFLGILLTMFFWLSHPVLAQDRGDNSEIFKAVVIRVLEEKEITAVDEIGLVV